MSLSAAKLALAVKHSRIQSGAPEMLNSEPVAVIGIGCRFPGGGHSPDAFWQLLHEGRDAIRPIPPGRWPITPHLATCQAGFLEEVDGFDASFFGIPPREAERMDPQHRLLLEVIWEALWDARLEPETTAGERNGVFAAIYNNDYFRLQFRDPGQINAYTSSGTSHSAAVGRVSFLLDWKGPSVAVDTACSSSLVAVHMACRSLRTGECHVAVAGGVSLMLAPEEMISLTKLGMLSPDWRCKTFDARADGFVPGEGCGIVVLKRLADALADGDPIRAVIRGTAINQDGRTSVLTAPNGLAQRAVICDALANAQISGSEVGYVEAHGTGTALGDPIEMEALAEILGKGPGPCFIGSVKSNIGHLEAAAGVTGVIKAVLATEHEEIPQSLHFRELNPHVSLKGTRLSIADRAVAWPRGTLPRFSSVSSFGFGGTNAHAVLEEAPASAQPRRAPVQRHKWNRTRYWFAPPAPVASRAIEHPLAGRRLNSPVLRETVFENALGARQPDFLGDHKPGGEAVLPLAAFLEMFLAASGATGLEEVSIHQALALPAGDTCQVQTVADGAGLRLFAGHGGSWTLYASGRTAGASGTPDSFDPDDLAPKSGRCMAADEFYALLESRGLRFGPSFRSVRELWTDLDTAVAHVAVPACLDGYRIHPVLLDGCLQAAGALLQEPGTFLPFGVERFTLFRAGAGPALWSRATLRPRTGRGLVVDIDIYDADGQPVARVDGLLLRKSSRDEGVDHICEIAWRPRPRQSAGVVAAGGRWVIFADSGNTWRRLADRLESARATFVVVRRGDTYDDQLGDPELTGVAHFWSLDAPPDRELDHGTLQVCNREIGGSVLHAIQTLARRSGKQPRLAVVTQGAVSAVPGDRTLSLAQSPVWGLLRTACREHPELGCVALDLDPGCPPDEQQMADIIDPGSDREIAWRGGMRLVPGLIESQGRGECRSLEVTEIGRLESLRWNCASRRDPGQGEVEIEVAASGLNFRDVMNALGRYPGEAGPLGSECAGRIVATGPGVANFEVGDEVVAIARGTFASRVITSAGLVQLKPAAIRMDEAAAIPIACVTARYALHHIGKLRAGDRVLIHAAAGGVGLAAVREAQRVGAEVFATAGTEEKRAYLRSLGVRHLASSRTLDYARQFLDETGGRGVDLVLNSLTGQHISESLNLLASGGRFLELGKTEVWEPKQVGALRKDVAYFVLDWSEEFSRAPGLIESIFGEIIRDLDSGHMEPLACRTFGTDDAVHAFRWMAQARQVGKIVLRCGEPFRAPRRDASYLITGGLGALGIRTAEWLSRNGAGEIVLVGRSDPGPAVRDALERISSAGTKVRVCRADVSRRSDLAAVMRDIGAGSLPLRGVIHAAGVLDDGVLTELDWKRFERVMAPKVEGAWHLHELTVGLDLDFFVLFSSLASAIGSPGQGNYAAANAFLDGLAHYRRSLGLPGLSINWGPWGEAGMAAAPGASGSRRAFPGLTAISPERSLELLNQVLLHVSAPQVAVFQLRTGSNLSALESGVLRSDASLISERAPGCTPGDRLSRSRGEGLIQFLREQLAKVMGTEDYRTLDTETPLFDAGLDSLMAVEFRNELASAFERPFPSTLLFDYPTIAKLAAFLEGNERSLPESHDERLAREISALADAQAEVLLNAELEKGA